MTIIGGVRSVVSVVALALCAAPSFGAQVTHVHWDVVGGWFASGLLANGPIAGGAIDWTPPGGVVTTPGAFPSGKWTVRLSGPYGQGGVFTIRGYGGTLSLTPGYAKLYPRNVQAYSGWSSQARYPTVSSIVRMAVVSLGNGNGTFIGRSGFVGNIFSHDFVLGNEVRSGPQQAPSMGPLGGMVLGFGIVAIVARVKMRARRRQRL